MEKNILWLDDVRNPFTDKWMNYIETNTCITKEDYKNFYNIIWVKNYDGFTSFITKFGMPFTIFFDNDLGEEKEGYDCAKWLVDYCIDHNCAAPKFYIQSDNGPAQDNIKFLLNNYNTFFEKK